MPRPRRVLNAFTADEVHEITGITVHMLNYLARAGYVEPFYGEGVRGKVRFYSYRDLVIAQIVQRLRETGVKLARLKTAMETLHEDYAWIRSNRKQDPKPIQWLVSDGKEVLFKHEDGFLDELKPGGQRAFAFVVTLSTMQAYVCSRIKDPVRLANFSIRNRRLRYDEPANTGPKRQKSVAARS
jgi:DNA-binding transcriptional MerR regulator